MNFSISYGKNFCNLTWEDSINDGGAEILGYRVYRNDTENNFSIHADIGPDQLSFNDTDVINGVNYSYYVVAYNREGESTPSEIVNGTPFGRPLPPQNIQVARNNQTLNLTWDAPTDTGGYPVLLYNVYWKETSSQDWNNETTEYDHYLFDNLHPGTQYTFKVSANTEIGEGFHSSNYTGYIPLPPDSPLNLTATAGSKYVFLNWDPPDDVGDAEVVEKYILYRNDTFYTNISSDINEYNDTGLVNGITYCYRISAFTIAGEGDLSNEVSAMPKGLPGIPTDLNYTIQNENDITITWNAPLDTGGVDILSYKIYKYENGELSGENEVFLEEFMDEDITKGIEVTYRISAVNSLGEGRLSDPLTVFIELGGLPSSPRTVTLKLLDNGIELSWFEPLETGEGPIEGYRIYRKIENISDFIVIDDIQSITKYLDDNIEPNTTYIYKLTAYNAIGEGPFSTEREIFIEGDYQPPLTNHTNGEEKFQWWIYLLVILPILLIVPGIIIFLRKKNKTNSDQDVLIDQNEDISLEEEIFGIRTDPSEGSVKQKSAPLHADLKGE
ncbi:MAG: fibronectin type III domain-containing protein [Candidatus Thermoplasmatota archaeon]|nr:fibronectin type III domain-containing protein [Candidatus Thermoplasmatota archaeon]